MAAQGAAVPATQRAAAWPFQLPPAAAVLAWVVLLALALLTLVLVAAAALDVFRGTRSLARLAALPPWAGAAAPRVSVLVPARNEARHIEEALGSVLAQDYPNLEVVVVDDRSTDGTGAILDRMAAATPRLRVVHLTEVPSGWLGKNHALAAAAARATGEWLLFTDADVVMDPSTVGRAVRHAAWRPADHLAVLPEVRLRGFLLQAFVGVFSILFLLYSRPWKAPDPRSSRFIGVGAFNLVRADVYRAIGTHAAIAMRPDDDIKLGKLVKGRGYRQEAVAGRGMIAVEWYASVREMVDGLMKNSFAGVDYSLARLAAATMAMLALFLWPFLALVATGGATRLANAATALLLLALFADCNRWTGIARWSGIAFPLGVLFFVYVLWRSALLTLATGGIRWRDTHYPLAALRANRV